MKLFQVEIQNFRQFWGINTIKISTDPEKNFTIIQGDNGSGKSNFMNALIWCLHGDEIFRSQKNEGRELANERAVQTLKNGQSIDVSVAVDIGESQVEYRFERKIVYTGYSNGPSSRTPTFKGFRISDKGYESISDPEWYVNRLFIPKELRQFFFFDGEKIGDYFEDVSKIKQNVEKIAQIDVIKETVNTLSDAVKELNREIGKFKPDLIASTQTQNDTLADIENITEQKNEVDSRLLVVAREIEKIDEYLRENSNSVVKEIQKNLDSLRSLKKIKTMENVENDIKIKNLISERAAVVFASDALSYSKSLIESEVEAGTLPPNVKDVFLRELLDSGVCICGRDLSKDDECRRKVEELIRKTMPSDIANDANNGKYVISSLLEKVDFRDEYIQLRQKRREIVQEIENLERKIDDEESKLNACDDFKINEMEESRRKLTKEQNQLNVRKGTLGNKLVSLNKERNEEEERIKRAAKAESATSRLQDQKEYAEYLKSIMGNIKESIVDEIRQILEEKTRNYFFEMIWKKDAFSDVRIIDTGGEYKISVKSEFGNECLGDLSAGEKQVLALSFTAALYSVSGYSVPVVIDTPLGRISSEPRKNIAASLPGYLSETQVIMLATDTEYTKPIRDELKRSVGAEYKIKHDEEEKISTVIPYE